MVSLKSTVSGGVKYERTDLGADQAAEDGKKVTRWETTKVVEGPEEHARAEKARGTALKGIRRACNHTSFGLICSESNEAELDAAIAKARAVAEEFNAGATFTTVRVYVLKGRIASSDEEAARAVGEEVQGLINAMSTAIDNLDAEGIREAASRAAAMSAMLEAEQAETVSAAVTAARKAARQIVKRIEKDGESAKVVLADIQRGAIEKARIAFLDLDDTPAPAGDAMPAVDVQRTAAIDLDDTVAADADGVQ